MAFSRLVFTILFLCVSCYANDVPAFLWGKLPELSTKANPLETIPSGEFRTILKNELADDTFTVVFVDATLSVEDFSRKNAYGESSFPFLRSQLPNALYLPSVNDPLRVLKKLADPEDVDHVKLTENGLSAEIESPTAKVLFINLKDAREGESRVELLRRHNDFMEDMFTKLQERKKNVLAVYTAHFPSWVIPSESHLRVRRQATENRTVGNDYHLDGLRFYVKELLIIDGNTTTPLNEGLTSSTVINGTEQNVTMTFGDNSFVLNFRLKAGYWFFDSVTFGVEELQPDIEVYALEQWSYRCAQDVFFKGANISRGLKFEDVQIQPYFAHTNESLLFGETFDCVGYFSGPIWASLMVTFLLLAITFYGIMMMMDIRTMDRFDDPKGKTITINTSE